MYFTFYSFTFSAFQVDSPDGHCCLFLNRTSGNEHLTWARRARNSHATVCTIDTSGRLRRQALGIPDTNFAVFSTTDDQQRSVVTRKYTPFHRHFRVCASRECPNADELRYASCWTIRHRIGRHFRGNPTRSFFEAVQKSLGTL